MSSQRVQAESAFARILDRIVRSIPGCRAAAFVDQEGEAVDVAGYGTEFDIKVAGAHLRVVMAESETLPHGTIHDLVISASRTSYRIHVLPEGYALMLILASPAAFSISHRALNAATRALSKEAGFDLPVGGPKWFPVDVYAEGGKLQRPRRARGASHWFDVQVLGSVMGLGRRERGYRVRLDNGNELTFVREPLGRWWADDAL